MHNQPFFMFKSNPFDEEFKKYQGRTIKTLQIQNFSFFNPTQHAQHSYRNKIHLQKPKNPNKTYSSALNPLQTFCVDNKDPKHFAQNYSLKNPKFQTTQSLNKNVKETKKIKYEMSSNRKKVFEITQIITETPRIKQTKNMPLTQRNGKTDQHSSTRFCSFNASNDKNVDKIHLKQRLYQSIDFDNLFSKIQSQVTQCDRSYSPESSPKIKDRLIMLDKMKRYSKTPNSKARTVFDQFNLKYLINKRKNFNLKNQSNIKGSHLPYFQSFNSYEIKNLTKNSKEEHQMNTSLEKISGRCQQISGQQGESKKKTSSFIVIDDHGIVHEQNPECKDRDQMIKKISGKVINMRQMLKIQKIQPMSSR